MYAIPCTDCPKFYIGETKRPTKTRIKEEQRDIHLAKSLPNKKFSEDNDFGYVQHLKETNHSPDFANAKVLKLESHHHRRKLLEGMFIQRNKHNLTNLKAGTEIDKIWLPFLNDK